MGSDSGRARGLIQWSGLVGGPLLAVLCFQFLPEHYLDAAGARVEFSREGRSTLLLMIWMAVWWLTEAVEIQATALLPVVLLPLLGASTIGAASAPYGDKLIFLFMGGFIMALAMQRWGLDRRIALGTLRVVGTRPANLVGGFMLATAALSAFVSNTATTAMMLPIGLSVIELFRDGRARGGPVGESNFGVCLMLSIAYAASIGGISTIIGSPPNGFLVGFVKENYSVEISFLTWMGVGLPVVVCMLPITWLLLTRVLHPLPRTSPPGTDELIHKQLSGLGRISRGEWTTLVVFGSAVACWITRPLLQDLLGTGLDDAGIAITAGVAMFVIPVDLERRQFAIDWETARKMPWGVLILFGGGMSLAAAVKDNGVASFIGSQTAALGGVHPLVLMLIVTSGMIFLTELTSNLATTATIVPILAALAPGLGLHPFTLIVPATLAASCAFMLPVATPPNAILFGSGYITIPQMCRAGLWLNIIGIALVTALTYGLGLKLLGV